MPLIFHDSMLTQVGEAISEKDHRQRETVHTHTLTNLGEQMS